MSQEIISFVLDYPNEAAEELAKLRELKAELLQALRDVAENTVSLDARSKVYAAIEKAQ